MVPQITLLYLSQTKADISKRSLCVRLYGSKKTPYLGFVSSDQKYLKNHFECLSNDLNKIKWPFYEDEWMKYRVMKLLLRLSKPFMKRYGVTKKYLFQVISTLLYIILNNSEKWLEGKVSNFNEVDMVNMNIILKFFFLALNLEIFTILC